MIQSHDRLRLGVKLFRRNEACRVLCRMFDRISLAIFAVPLVLASATYTYDNGGRLIKVDYGAAGSVTYTYDSAGHLTGRQLAPSTSVTVSGVTSPTANGTYGVGAAISIQVSLSAPVNVTGVPQLALNSGGTANYSSGSGSANLTFTYTIAAAQSSTRLDYTSTTALTLNGGTIKDSSGNAANLTLPTPGATGSLSSNKNIVISTAAVTFTITAPSPVAAGTAFNFTVTAKDTSGNTATAYSGTLHFSSTDSSATLPANTTLSSGVGTFAATLRTTGNQTITAIDTVTPSITGTSSTISVAAPPAPACRVS